MNPIEAAKQIRDANAGNAYEELACCNADQISQALIDCVEVLGRLVAAKEEKYQNGKSEKYEQLKEGQWVAASELLEKLRGEG